MIQVKVTPTVEVPPPTNKNVNQVPNPAPLGLIAFGLTTALLQIKHARFGGSDAVELSGVDVEVMGFALFFGGLLQILAGQNEIKRNNLFGYTAFSVYGGFWMSLGIIKLISLVATNTPTYINPKAAQGMLFMLFVISLMFWTLTLIMNKTICSLFGLLSITVILLSFGVQNETIDKVGGYFGVATSINAFWLAYAELVNDVIGKGAEIIPLGRIQWSKTDPTIPSETKVNQSTDTSIHNLEGCDDGAANV